MMERCFMSLHHLHRCSKMFDRCSEMLDFDSFSRLLDLCERRNPVIVFRYVGVVDGTIMLRHIQRAVSHKAL